MFSVIGGLASGNTAPIWAICHRGHTLSAFYHLNITEEIENMTGIPASIHHLHHHINIPV